MDKAYLRETGSGRRLRRPTGCSRGYTAILIWVSEEGRRLAEVNAETTSAKNEKFALCGLTGCTGAENTSAKDMDASMEEKVGMTCLTVKEALSSQIAIIK